MTRNKKDSKSYEELLKSLDIVENFFRKRTFVIMADNILEAKELLKYFIEKESQNES